MKKKACVLTILLTLLCVFSVSMAVYASPEKKIKGEAPALSLTEIVAPDSGQSENPEGDMSALQGNAADDKTPAPPKSDNTPFFIGAGIAVLIFVGVALYCKANGNKSY